MINKKIKKFCPTCGKPMEYVESKENQKVKKNELKRFEIWNCLNCSEEWQIDIINNVMRKNPIMETQ